MAKSNGDPIAMSWRHATIDDLAKLRKWIQNAVQLELTTIPAYLCALYSIKDKASNAYQALRSVVTEEMFHLNQAANLLVAVGGKPKLTGHAVPRYPAFLPSASRTATPYVGLYRASSAVFENVFMAVEMPAPYNAPAEGEHYKTIGQFYKAIEDGLQRCVQKYGEAGVFRPARGMRQRSDIYLGKFGGSAVTVKNMKSARFAIRQIMEQGEGAVDPTNPLVEDQPFGTYNYYGQRIDGTYGPILGTPYELSHYFKFKRIVEAGNFPDTYPIAANLRLKDIKNEEASKVAVLFNKYYSIILKSMELSFMTAPGGHDAYFEVALPLMHHHLPKLAHQLMTSLIMDEGDATVGPNAAPTFEYDPRARLDDVVATLEGMSRHTQARAKSIRATVVGRSFAFAKEPPKAPELVLPTRLPPVNRIESTRRHVFGDLADNLRQIQQRSKLAGLKL